MIIHALGQDLSILNQFVLEMRDVQLQQDGMRFRRNIERIGELLGYELSKTLRYGTREVQTPLGVKQMEVPEDKLVLCAVLRAGLPLHQGLLNYFDGAENAFISAFRHHPLFAILCSLPDRLSKMSYRLCGLMGNRSKSMWFL